MSEVSVRRAGAQRMGFFTDTTVCIGCKACEVACKQWNDLPADGASFRKGGSYDHTGRLSAATWRHVRFVETLAPSTEARDAARELLERGGGGAVPVLPAPDDGRLDPGVPPGDLNLVAAAAGDTELDRWVFMSDVCKHCTNAGCMDACPTGALVRTEFDTVIVQPDVCNGCGYCVPSCPFGVIDRDPYDGRAAKCTLCYDRLQDGMEPACAKSCPTDSIQFGPYEELRERAGRRVAELHSRGMDGAYLYGADEDMAGGLGAFFLLTEPPERFGLPAAADSPIQENGPVANLAGFLAAGAGLLGVVAGVAWSHRRAGR